MGCAHGLAHKLALKQSQYLEHAPMHALAWDHRLGTAPMNLVPYDLCVLLLLLLRVLSSPLQSALSGAVYSQAGGWSCRWTADADTLMDLVALRDIRRFLQRECVSRVLRQQPSTARCRLSHVLERAVSAVLQALRCCAVLVPSSLQKWL